MNYLEKLASLREQTGAAFTCGLSEDRISAFLEKDTGLKEAIDQALVVRDQIGKRFPNLVGRPESELVSELSEGILNFYPPETVCPYVPLAGKGPWIVTLTGGVVYDTGGYGMMGQGQEPEVVTQEMCKPQMMANIMTPSFSHRRFVDVLREKIGCHRPDKKCPYDKFICMNTGTGSMAVALRLSDTHAKTVTDPGSVHEGKPIRILSFEGSFHGRSNRPARISHSTRQKYLHLASFRDIDREHIAVPPNDIAALRTEFNRLINEGIYIEAVVLEPVMGEGNPGLALNRDFYDEVRQLTKKHQSLLIIDSIQAGLRAQGVLSIVDYPDFLDCERPDMETFSKALNAGQYPLSVLAMTEEIASEYVLGTYGNTMTANPRALDVGSAVVENLSDALTQNVRARGIEFVEKLQTLQENELKGLITKVQGTGLLTSAELVDGIRVVGVDGVEQEIRKWGVNVIHGGINSLRFTPWFWINSEEIDLICEATKESVLKVANR